MELTVRRPNPGWGEIFRTVQTDPGAHLASYTMGTGSFPGVKRPGGGVAFDHPPRTNAEVEERAQLYLWALVACSGTNLTFTITFTTLL